MKIIQHRDMKIKHILLEMKEKDKEIWMCKPIYIAKIEADLIEQPKDKEYEEDVS